MKEDDPIQAAVETCANKIQRIVTEQSPGFLAVHFLCGEHEKPGFIRKSALRLGEQFINSLGFVPITEANIVEYARLNRKALKRHVRVFERGKTLLSLALNKMNVNGHKGFMFRVGGNIGKEVKSSLPEGWDSDNLEWHIGIGEFLVPHDKAVAYLKRLYSEDKCSPELLEDFEMQRAEAFGRWASKNSSEANPLKKEDTWKEINPLQSSLIYFSVAQQQVSDQIIGDFLIFKLPNDISKEKNIYPHIVIVMSPAFKSPIPFDKIQAVITNEFFVNRHVINHLYEQVELEKMKHRLGDVLALGKNKEEIFKIIENESDILPIPGHSQRCTVLIFWLSILGKSLSDQVHEGKPLEFWFVAGDLSEFEDHPDIIFEKHFSSTNEQREIFSPPNQNHLSLNEIEVHASRAAKLLAKEHFPWFEDGRYALFFDLANQHMHAVGLCSVKHSTWSYIYSEVYKSADEQTRKHGIKIPMCLISYVSRRHGGNGIAICHPEAKTEKKIKQLMRFDRGAWQTAEDLRSAELLKFLNHKFPDKANLEPLVNLCIMLADNPQTGGTIIFVKDKKYFNEFLQMGKPWDFDERPSHSDKVPLMAHDGATLVYLGTNEQDFLYRSIPMADNIKEDIRTNLKQVSEISHHESPLSGVGTRRWNAVLSAFTEGVEAVIVISQDGDINCWDCPNWENAKYIMMPLGLRQTPKEKKLSELLTR